MEPEKRSYPLIMAADYQKGEYEVLYGMPDLSVSTGQEKSEDNGDNQSVVGLQGKTLKEIQTSYDSSQEKFLDLGHLQILVLGESLIQEGKWPTLLRWLRENPAIGEDIYLFTAPDVDEVMELNGTLSSSLGEYLIGIYENRPITNTRKGVSLRRAYGSMLEKGELVSLPELQVEDGSIRILFSEEE